MGLRKFLRQRNIFVNEDLTSLNQEVFTPIRLRGEEEVRSVWTKNGRIMIRRYDDSISPVDFKYYNQWLALPLPSRNGQEHQTFHLQYRRPVHLTNEQLDF